MSLSTADKVKKAVIQLMLQEPFFGVLISRLDFVEDDTLPGKTMATDGRKVYIHPEFVANIDGPNTTSKDGVPGVAFVIAHEIMHNVYDHFDRRGSRNPVIWNYAGDYVINAELLDMRVPCLGGGRLPTYLGEECGLYEAKYKGQTTEEVYEQIKEDLKDQLKASFDNGDGNPMDGDGNPMSSQGLEDLLEELLGKNFDEHMMPDTDPNHPANQLSDADKAEIGREMRSAVQQAFDQAENASRGAGNVPGGVRRIINDLRKPQVDWRDYVTSRTKDYIKNDHTYAKPSRRSFGSTFVLPGQDFDDKVSITVAVDNSGSISQNNLVEFLSEVYGMLTQFNTIDLTVFAFDTQIDERNIFKFDRHNIEDVKTTQFVGCGGTSFECIFEYLQRENEVPEILIVATDGYPCGSWGDPDYCETIFLICDDKEQNIKAPFGRTVWYDAAKN